jgi:hypothetical protein
MYVREKDGFYAGQIREFPSHIALELIRSGRGEDPFAEPQAESEQQTEPQPTPQTRPHGRRQNRERR